MNSVLIIVYGISNIIFIINIILCVLSMKFDKKSKMIWLISVMAFIIDLIGISTYSLETIDKEMISKNNTIYYILRSFAFVIQCFILFLIIYRIIKRKINRKKDKAKKV